MWGLFRPIYLDGDCCKPGELASAFERELSSAFYKNDGGKVLDLARRIGEVVRSKCMRRKQELKFSRLLKKAKVMCLSRRNGMFLFYALDSITKNIGVK